MPNNRYWQAFVTLLFFVVTALASEQESIPPPVPRGTISNYANTKEGLRQFLDDVRAAARDNPKKLAALIKTTEIPDCAAWLHTMYESDKADSWMGLCDAKTLAQEEKSMGELFVRLAEEDGEIIARNVNDNPQPGRGQEWGWLQAIKRPLDIYWANWKSSDPKESEQDPIGYFMYIDGGFRWDSGIKSYEASETKITNAKIVPAKLVKKIAPVYPPEAASKHITGTVRVYYVIGGDGAVYNAHAITAEGFSDDANLRKAAEEAVRQWRFQPGTIDGKPLQMTVTSDIVFALNN